MGATNFVEIMKGYDNHNDAYQQAVDDAIYDYGNDPYNGTISTTSGYDYLGEVSRKDLEKYIDDRIDNYWKWGKCGCVYCDGSFVFFGWAAV